MNSEYIPELGDIWTEPATGMEFVYLPGGSFIMGSPEDEEGRRKDEGPQHKVTLDGFWIGRYEVTQGQWQKLMGSNPSRFQEGDTVDYPVERVSWDDCQEFIQKLNSACSSCGSFRLPTEAEWEYTCRAGTTTPFSCGATISTDQANYDGNFTYGNGRKGAYRERTVPVGSFKPNAFGIYDMHGNVWEWCADWYSKDYYGVSPEQNPAGSDFGLGCVNRGGGWGSGPRFVRSAFRFRLSPGLRSRNLGFRLVAPGRCSSGQSASWLADWVKRRIAVEDLGRLGAATVVEPLLLALADESPRVRTGAAWALGKVGDRTVVEALWTALDDPDELVRAYSVQSLGRLGDLEVLELLAAGVIENDDWLFACSLSAVQVLGESGRSRSVPWLLSKLADQATGARVEIIKTLGLIADPAAVVPLCQILESEADKKFHQVVKVALSRIGPESVPALQELLHSVDYQTRKLAAEVLEKFKWGPATVSERVAFLIGAQSWEVLADEVGAPAVTSLISLLDDSAVEIQIAAVRTLGQIGDHRSVSLLLSKLADPAAAEILPKIAAALASIPDIRVLAPLTAYYKGKSSSGSEATQVVEELTRRIAAFQQELMKDFSTLLCLECCCRPRRQKIRLGLFKSQAVAVCPRCGTSMLTTGIKEVVGVIDNQTGQELDDGILTVHIWDQQNPNCTYADLDRLEIRAAAGVNYDFAANAMWLTFHDSGIRDPAYWKKHVPVQIINNPPISPGMVSMIRENFLSVIEETR